MQKSSFAAVLLAASVAPLGAVDLPVVGPLAPVEAIKPEPAAPVEPAAPSVPERLTLDQALRFSLENNYAIRQARERLRVQEGIVIVVRDDDQPYVTAEGD